MARWSRRRSRCFPRCSVWPSDTRCQRRPAAHRAGGPARSGRSCLVPVREAVDLASGVGLPADYPHSLWTEPPTRVLPRDERLMAWEAMASGRREIRLTDDDLDELSTAPQDAPRTAPHAELAIRVRSTSQHALDSGDFTLDVRPAWTTGNLTGRFASLLGDDLASQYRTLPTMVDGALPAQLSFAPVFPHAENVARIPALVPHVISVAEHRPEADNVITLDDLAVYGTGHSLHLVSISRRKVVEPVVLHPLALEKQAPPVARFLAMLGRGFATHWTEFDWGPLAAGMPFLPRVSYRNTTLTPARWRLSTKDLPGPFGVNWRKELASWADKWRCPDRVELRDDDRALLLDLGEPLHAQLLHRHLQTDEAHLTEAPTDEELDWIGHAHEVVVPLASTQQPLPHPDLSHAPLVTNRSLAHATPGQGGWLQAKVFTHPTVMDEILTHHLPALLDELDGHAHWFVRYRPLQEEDHLRLRVAAVRGPDDAARTMRSISAWAAKLTEDRLASRLVFDAYRPEIGRYGTGPAMTGAEDVFTADSLVVRHMLTDLSGVDRRMLCALGMVDIARGLLGDDDGLNHLASITPTAPGDPEVTRRVLRAAGHNYLASASPRLAGALVQRRTALRAYQEALPADRRTTVLESLLHMHHNRVMGPDRESEAAARHAARQACRSLLARRNPQ
ncbi:lantibiotic dehydratase [Streptomyces cavernicola]|uniref:Lantibiotic dehydratase n=1 Tax=Streptomyces cavernicola TaxID=3043613 RepID=A0ABT6SP38_9ACTN|nr:lantibiotic dehydratase [Streptomyces sp. B-S-A6]MDI3409447.1 lantibiotic dehydratase [Streptomyces sp. B-S-A6]